MGYQELLIRSKEIPLNKIADMINEGSNKMVIDPVNRIATVKENFTTDKVVILGNHMNIQPMHFDAGEQFLVLTGERVNIDYIRKMLLSKYSPASIDIYPIENVMSSPQNIGKSYNEIFKDAPIETGGKLASKINQESTIAAMNSASGQYDYALERLGAENRIGEFYLTQDDIEVIHNDMCYRYGGAMGIRDMALFQSVCMAPYQSVFGQDLYPTPFDKAAKYLYDFANYQVFIDGNKRTGLAVAATYLIGNGYKLTLSQMQMYELTMNVANGRIKEADDIAKILHVHADLGKILPIMDDVEQERDNEYMEL